MDIKSTRREGAVWLELVGDLEEATIGDLERHFRYHQQAGEAHFVASLEHVGQVDASGLRVLLGLARSLPRMGGSLVLYGVNERVRRGLQIAGLGRVFDEATDAGQAEALSLEHQGRLRSRADQHDLAEKVELAIRLLDGG